MFCSKCGTENDNGSKYCKNCGNLLENVSENNNPVNNYTSNVYTEDVPTFSPVHSIILLLFALFCCGGGIIGMIFPILSLVEGDKVKELVAKGDINGARIAKKNSDKWIRATYITLAIIALLIIMYIALMVFFGLVANI